MTRDERRKKELVETALFTTRLPTSQRIGEESSRTSRHHSTLKEAGGGWCGKGLKSQQACSKSLNL